MIENFRENLSNCDIIFYFTQKSEVKTFFGQTLQEKGLLLLKIKDIVILDQ